MAWEFESGLPIYLQAADMVQKRVIKGDYPRGSRLPSVRDLAMEAGVNPNTMQRALLLLEERGIVFSQRTAGRFVTEDAQLLEALKYQTARKQVLSFVKRMDELGYGPEELEVLLRRVIQEESTAAQISSENIMAGQEQAHGSL